MCMRTIGRVTHPSGDVNNVGKSSVLLEAMMIQCYYDIIIM